MGDRVLCVDLDGTLIATDLLWESLLSAMRTRPWIIFAAPLWLLRGRAYLKHKLAEAASIDFANLPYRIDVVEFVAGEHRRGRRIVLATAANELLASRVSSHLGIFDEVMASDGQINLKGRTKAESLVKRFGSANFDYIGDSQSDVHCWACATDAINVGASTHSHVRHLRRLHSTEPAMRSRVAIVLSVLRPHQWLKNLLVFVPAVSAHRMDFGTVQTLILAFVALSAVASGGYVLNDLLDLRADRQHPRKKNRPLASGQLSLVAGMILVGAAWVVGFGLAAWALSGGFVLVLAIYLSGTVAYSMRLKREPVLDVMFLAGLYVLRIVAGGVAAGIVVSTWLLAFTLFVCLSLALMKRFIEVHAQPTAAISGVPGRGYQADDAQWLQAAGLASAYLSVVVLATYVNSDAVALLYDHPDRLLLICPVLLYWGTRVWLHAHRRWLHDDPVVAVAADPVTYMLLAICAVVILTAA
jgi:4-hydroxybenzoate polyprenyltransferase